MELKKWQKLSGSALKIIAIIAMFIDHFTKEIITNKIAIVNRLFSQATIDYIYFYGRLVIGRLAFPIFCFLLVEGFKHTSNRKKYLMGIGIFALISEIPFDLFNNNQLIYLSNNNVFFTLFIGLAALMLLEKYKGREIARAIIIMASIIIAAITGVDYGALGVILILLIYLANNRFEYLLLVGSSIFLLNPSVGFFAFISFLIMGLYNGKRGLNIKYAFYIFYPLHLILLYLLRIYII